jgi:hypothetical protein
MKPSVQGSGLGVRRIHSGHRKVLSHAGVWWRVPMSCLQCLRSPHRGRFLARGLVMFTLEQSRQPAHIILGVCEPYG